MFLALAALVLVTTRALLPRHSPFLYWPAGLAAIVVSLYFESIFFWATGAQGLTKGVAKWNFVVLVAFSAVVATFRLRSPQRTPKMAIGRPGSIVVISSSLLTIGIGAWMYFHDQVSMIGSYLAGGDHGHHVEYMTGLIAGSGHRSYSNPFSLTSYPMGIHFLLSHLYVGETSLGGTPELARRHLIPALFEYVQLAALVSLFLLIIVRRCSSRRWMSAIVSVLSLGLVFSVHKFFNHLFWSGFTTSLALTWIVLLALALPWNELGLGTRRRVSVTSAVMFIVLFLATWFVYQPFVLIPASIAGSIVLRFFFRKAFGGISATFEGWNFGWTAVSSLGLVLVSIAPLALAGKKSPGLQSLVQWGVCWHISQPILVAAVASACILLWARRKGRAPDWGQLATIFTLFLVMTITMLCLAAYVSPYFTLRSQPYYVQKMFWILFVVAACVAAAQAVDVMDNSRLLRSTSSRVALCAVISLVAPLVWTSANREIRDRIKIDWFAADMFAPYTKGELRRSAVFNTWENLGAHVGNIAIEEDSDRELTGDIPVSKLPEWACWQLRNDDTRLIFTATGQSLELVKAGCDQYAIYIESGRRVGRLILPTEPMVIGKTVKTNAKTRGVRFLLTGFEKSQDDYTWATGFHSTVQMIVPRLLPAATLSLAFVRSWVPDTVEVNLYVNSHRIQQRFLGKNEVTTSMGMSDLMPGDVFRIELNCRRSYEAASHAADGGNNRQCIALKHFRIDERSVEPAS